MIRAGSLGKFGKEARKIRVRLDAIGAGRFDQRIQAGTRGRASGGLTEESQFLRPITNGLMAFSTRLVSSGIWG